MPGFLRLVPVMVAIAAAGGCAQILNTHSSGDGPSGVGSIPGPPPGDSVAASGQVLFNGGNIQLIGNDTQTASADLIPGGHPHNTTEYAISFAGVRTTTTAPVVAFDALDASGDVACGLEMGSGQFRFVGGAGEVIIGSYTGQADQHNVFWRIDLSGGRCFIRIEQVAQGTDGPPVQPLIVADVPVITADFDELERLRVRWENVSSGAVSYFLGPVIISKRIRAIRR